MIEMFVQFVWKKFGAKPFSWKPFGWHNVRLTQLCLCHLVERHWLGIMFGWYIVVLNKSVSVSSKHFCTQCLLTKWKRHTYINWPLCWPNVLQPREMELFFQTYWTNNYVKLKHTIIFFQKPWTVLRLWMTQRSGNTKGGSITVLLTFCLTGLESDNFCFYLQNRLIQISQTGGQWYSDTFPLVLPATMYQPNIVALDVCWPID